MKTYVEIDTAVLTQNLRHIQAHLPDVPVMAVIKENAYGHGLIPVARLCAAEGLTVLAVTSVREGIKLREAGISLPIFLLSRISADEAEPALLHDLTIPFSCAEDITLLQAELDRHPGQTAHISLAVDTGMNRYGFLPAELIQAKDLLVSDNRLHIDYIYSHLTSAEEETDSYSDAQFSEFDELCRSLELPSGVRRMISNSAAILRYPHMNLDTVRTGCLVYGIYAIEGRPLPWDLKPAFSFHTVVTHIHKSAAGRPVSYNRLYTVKDDSYIATIAGGYSNGIPSQLTNKGRVLIKGKFYPIVGSVCMSQFMVNLGPDTDIKPGDQVTLLGSNGDALIPAEELEQLTGMKLIEILTNLAAHNPVLYK